MLQYSLVGPLHDAMSKVHKYSVYGVCTTNGAPGRAPPAPTPAHTLTATVAHTFAHTPRSAGAKCRAQQLDAAKAPNRCVTRPSCRKRILRRLSHDTRQKGRKGVADARACRGHSNGSREIPMVRTPADPLGSRTPSRGRSQRRDTGRGPDFRCMRTSTRIGQQQQGRCATLAASAYALTSYSHRTFQELASAVNLVPAWTSGSKTRVVRSRCSCHHERSCLHMGNSV